MLTRVIAVLMLVPVLGCARAAMETGAATSSHDAVIRELEDQERMGVLNADVEALHRIWSEDLMVNSPMNTIAPNRATVLSFVREGRLNYSSFERRIEQIRIDGSIAVVMGAETILPVAEPAVPPVERRFTHIWRHEGGRWQLFARHANNIAPRGP